MKCNEFIVFGRKVWIDKMGRILVSKVRKHDEQAATLYIIGTAKFEKNEENPEQSFMSMTPVTIRWMQVGKTRDKGLLIYTDEGDYSVDLRKGHKFQISKAGADKCEAGTR